MDTVLSTGFQYSSNPKTKILIAKLFVLQVFDMDIFNGQFLYTRDIHNMAQYASEHSRLSKMVPFWTALTLTVVQLSIWVLENTP